MAVEMKETVQGVFSELRFDTFLTVHRSEQEHVQYSVAHGPLMGCTRLGVFVFDPDDERNPNCENTEAIELFQAEARLLRDFLNRSEVQKLLDI